MTEVRKIYCISTVGTGADRLTDWLVTIGWFPALDSINSLKEAKYDFTLMYLCTRSNKKVQPWTLYIKALHTWWSAYFGLRTGMLGFMWLIIARDKRSIESQAPNGQSVCLSAPVHQPAPRGLTKAKKEYLWTKREKNIFLASVIKALP